MIAFICDYSHDYILHFIALDALGLLALVVNLTRPRIDPYGQLALQGKDKLELFFSQKRNKLQVLSCIPFDWCIFIYDVVLGTAMRCNVPYYVYTNARVTMSPLNPGLATLAGVRHNYLPGYGVHVLAPGTYHFPWYISLFH
jgi:hypothetical protein